MNKILIEKIDNVFLRIHCEIGQALEIKEYLSCYAPNFQFNPKFQNKIWNGKISFFNVMTRELPIGLLPNLARFCNEFGYKFEFKFDVKCLYNNIDTESLRDFTSKIKEYYDSKYDLRDFQFEALEKAIQNKRGTILLPTGSGKSLTIFYLLQYLRATNRKTMLIVPSVSLVEQMYSDFQDYGWDDIGNHVTKLYSGEQPDFSKEILITTYQSIAKKRSGFFKEYGGIVIDETHTAKSVSIMSIMKNCENADYRIGFTGTLPTEKSDVYNISGYLGPTLYKKLSNDLIDKGILSRIKIANLLLKYPEDIVKLNRKRPYNEELHTIFNYEKRNKVLNYIFDHIPKGQNSLVLCHQIEHLKKLEEYLINKLDDSYIVYVIYGEIKPKEREYIRKMMDEEENVVLVGTYATMSTGINIKRIHNVIFASSYKSKIKILQSIGRGLRLHDSKELMILWDLVDDLTYENRNHKITKNHVYKHWEERLKYYKEQGFEYHTKTYDL